METKTKVCEMGESSRKSLATIDSVGDDLLGNILNRLPALHFASATCVNRSWHRICDSLLSTPKLASALSLNPSIQDAVDEVFNKVFAEPIRPHFAIVAIGQSFEMHVAIELITKKLGTAIPIICTAAFGLMGRDVASNSFKEIPQWGEEEEEDHFNNWQFYDPSAFLDGDFSEIFNRPKTNRNAAVMLTVGFLPGMKVAAVTLSQSKKDALFVDEFVTNIRECSAIASGCTSPAAIMLFAGLGTDTDGLLEKLDCAMSPETAIIGDGSSVFLCGGNCIQKNSKYSVAGVALLFMRDRDKPGMGNIQFHVALSTGMSPIGPSYKTVSVREIRGKGTTWLTAKSEGDIQELDGQTILNQIYDEMPDLVKYPSLYIGVVKRRKCFLGSNEVKWITSQVFHEVHGGDEAQLFVEGRSIKTGDPFRVFQSDSHMAFSSLENVYDKFRSLKQGSSGVGSSSCLTAAPGNNSIIFGGIVFACIGREDGFFGKYNVDSTPFLENFPGVPLAGLYCGNSEICRGDSSSYDRESSSHRCFSHSYSSVYFVMSYTPSGPGI
ncbi:F-box/LRR-repeat protein [Heracleum sosnowskyi]|uniref:F-box/LRR-repeat protein n=1 Tax=Heracleum sosnowskyi TaxID=360622 RepID=A0AAD8H1H9_9APIA|nr:F-box/LRR-repeat protein [Heracleum sosnowskyi]